MALGYLAREAVGQQGDSQVLHPRGPVRRIYIYKCGGALFRARMPSRWLFAIVVGCVAASVHAYTQGCSDVAPVRSSHIPPLCGNLVIDPGEVSAAPSDVSDAPSISHSNGVV